MGIPHHRGHVECGLKGVLIFCIFLTAFSEQVETKDNAGTKK